MSAAVLNTQLTAAIAAYNAADSLALASASELQAMLSLFQTAFNTASALQLTIDASFDANNGDALFASGVDPDGMAVAVIQLLSISTALVYVDDIVNRTARTITVISMAQQGLV